MAKILQFEIGPMQNFGYMIGDPKTREALIVDPAWDAQKLAAIVEKEGFKLKGLLISHAHYDHTNAIEEMLQRFDIPVYANINEIDYAKSGHQIIGSIGRTAKGMQGGDEIKLGETTITLLHTPGHTPGSQCALVEDRLLTGDTLFIDGCGRSDLPGGDPALLFQSLRRIAGLSPNIQIMPGHDYGDAPSRRLKDEMTSNPYLKMSTEEQFINAVG